MDADVSRIPATRLCLSDELLLETPEGPRWSRVIGLALDEEHVLAICEGQADPVRMRVLASIRVRRAGQAPPDHEDEAAVESGMATWYPGDLRAAGSAVIQHAAADGQGADAAEQDDDAISHYSGLYGGDLDHVVAALGGTPADLSPADLRAAAFQRSVAARRDTPRSGEADEDDAEAVDEQISGLYAGDLGHLVQRRDT
jgi:hypothetical protein